MRRSKAFVLITVVLMFVTLLSGCSKVLEDSQKYIVKVTVKTLDSESGKVVKTATTKTSSGKQGSTSDGVTTFQLEGEKDYTFISTAPYYNETQEKAHIGKDNIIITTKISTVKGKIAGRVVTEDDEGVEGAQVDLIELGKKTESDSEGNFAFEKVPINDNQTHTIIIEKAGFGQRTISNIKLEVSEEVKDLGKVILSSNPGILSGKVTDLEGTELNNIDVSIVEAGKSTSTDYNGSFEIEVMPGTYTVKFTNSNYSDIEEVVTIESDENKFINIKMEPKPGSISGIVVDNYGDPIYGVQVSIFGIDEIVETLSNGHFKFETIPPGNYTLEFSHPSFRVYNENVKVKSKQEAVMGNIMLQEKTGMLTGRVLEEGTDNPIANANVKVRETGEYVSTNSDGYYTFNNIRVADYTLEITATSFSSEVIKNVIVKENSVTSLDDVWLIKDPATVMGTVKDSLTNNALSNVLVVLNELDLIVETDESGSFKIEGIKAGSYSMTLTLNNYYQKNIDNLYLGPNETINLGTIQLDPEPCKITGITTPDAEVKIVETGEKLYVDDTGSFLLQNIQPGSYQINITLNNYFAKSLNIELTPGQFHDLGDVSLEAMPGKIIGSSNADTITILDIDEIIENTASTFNFDELAPGEYRLKFDKENYYSQEILIDVGPNQVEDIGTITLEPIPATINGYTDSDVRVKLLETGEEIIVGEGYFEFKDLEPRQYTISFTKEHFSSKEFTREVGPNEIIDLGTIHLEPIPATIIGQTNATEVKIVETEKVAAISNGVFTLENVQPGDYTVSFSRSNYFKRDINITVGPEETKDMGTIELEPNPGTIKGYLDSTYDVTLIQTGDSYNESGYFEFGDLTPGSYMVKVEKEDYYYKLYNIDLDAGQTKELGSITLNSTLPGVGETKLDEKVVSILRTEEGITDEYFNIDFPQTIHYFLSAYGTTNPGYARIYRPSGSQLVGISASSYTEKTKNGEIYVTELGSYRAYVKSTRGITTLDSVGSVDVYYYDDIGKPEISFDKTWGYGSSSYSIYISATDEHTGVEQVKYRLTDSQNPPSSYYSISNNTYVEINNSGTWYLHVIAIDKNGNEGYRREGPYIVN